MGLGSFLTLGVLLFLVVVGIGVLLYFIGIYNRLVQFKNDIARSFSNIDVMLKQRHDELPKLIETCKGYMGHERGTLEAVVKARNAYASATTPGEKAQADNMVTAALRQLFAVAEAYPDLKANQNFIQLQGRISEIEGRIAASRTLFNEDVNRFNIRIAQVPDVIVARFMNFQPHPLFEAPAADREDVQVKFT
jgi:LemA protein